MNALVPFIGVSFCIKVVKILNTFFLFRIAEKCFLVKLQNTLSLLCHPMLVDWTHSLILANKPSGIILNPVVI